MNWLQQPGSFKGAFAAIGFAIRVSFAASMFFVGCWFMATQMKACADCVDDSIERGKQTRIDARLRYYGLIPKETTK